MIKTQPLLSLFIVLLIPALHAAHKRPNPWLVKPMIFAPAHMTELEDGSQVDALELIEKKQYGPVLAQKLDTKYAWCGYVYKGNGIYEFSRSGARIHNYNRHMCEPSVTEEEAEKKHEEMEPPSFVGRDGTRHYAMMH